MAIAVVWFAARSRMFIATVLLFLTGTAAGWVSQQREVATLEADVPEGRTVLVGSVLADPVETEGFSFTLRPTYLGAPEGFRPWPGPRLVVTTPFAPGVVAGETIHVTGLLRKASHRFRGDAVAGVLEGHMVETIGSGGVPFRAGNWLRSRILAGVDRDSSDAAALLTGFLVGDTSALGEADIEALRRSGLSHFVAVSGSNVALFLAAWWIAAGPLAWGPRRRAAVGLAGLILFVIATRWEPSVVRASVMAAIVLGGRLASIPVDAWTALGGAVAILLVISPEMGGDVGFQLSVAATAGVLVGAGALSGRRPKWAWSALAATAAAQLAVTPLLLIHFGTVPLLSPAANLAAAPLVALATVAGGIGAVSGIDLIVAIGAAAASVVLGIARVGTEWPQLGVAPMTAVTIVGVLAARFRPWRGPAAIALAIAVLAPLVPRSAPEVPTAVFIDVGQGDAILLTGTSGETLLVDGGPDAGTLRAALRRYGVRRIDLMVASHRHTDHTTGLFAALEMLPVVRLWYPEQSDPDGVLSSLVVQAKDAGAMVEAPQPGRTARLGDFMIEVLGPLRPYASPNDGSLVLRVSSGVSSLLLSGDIEAVAQGELGPLAADVLKVPHQGAATSDIGWLTNSAGAVAVISVGPNEFGHPAPEVIDALEAAGSQVLRTDQGGDVVIPLG